MARLAEKNACCGCQACFNICPVSAITMEPDEEGFIYPVLDADRCIHCERCTGACPVLNRPHNNPYRKVYAAYASDKNERMRSSSGGVFSVLARLVLDSGGAECGYLLCLHADSVQRVCEAADQIKAVSGARVCYDQGQRLECAFADKT